MLSVEQLAERLRKAGHHVNAITEATDEEGAAAVLGCHERTMENWRDEGKGPPWFRTVRTYYPLAGLLEFISEKTRRTAQIDVEPGATLGRESKR